MKKEKLFEQLTSGKIRCLACQRYCQIADGKLGFCQTRINKKGQLYSLIYGILSGFQIDPVEKKPLYHFYPGSEALSFGTYGCNYRCKQCLNSQCSWGEQAVKVLQKLKTKTKNSNLEISNNFVLPEKIVELAIKNNCSGVAFTYNEPTIWAEYVYDCAKLCRAKNLHTIFVSNGSWSKECLKFLSPVIEATNIDIKGFYPETYAKMGAFFGDLLKITELTVKKYKIFTELTTLVIPTINDSEKELEQIAQWIFAKLGPEIPWHLSRFDPDLAPDKEFRKLPDTPIKTLKKAYEIGRQAGLHHIYVWAPPKSFGEELFSIGDTYCPKCGKLMIRRNAWEPEMVGLDKNKCKFCGFKLNLRL